MMPPKIEPLIYLLMQARDELHQLIMEQQLLEVVTDQMDAPNTDTLLRVQILLNCYKSRADNHLHQMKHYLARIAELVGRDEE